MCCKPDEYIHANAKQDQTGKPEDIFKKELCFLAEIKIDTYTPKSVKAVKNNQREEANMKGNPSRSAEPVDDFIVIAGGIPVGAKMKQKEMNSHSDNEQQGCNPLEEPRPKTLILGIHYLLLPQSHEDTKVIIFSLYLSGGLNLSLLRL